MGELLWVSRTFNNVLRGFLLCESDGAAPMPTVYAACEGGGTTFVVAIAHDDPTNIVERAEFKTTSPAETIGKCCGARGTRPLPHTPGRRHPATGGGAPELAPTLVTAATPLTRPASPLRPPQHG